jgi:hypothetical protein
MSSWIRADLKQCMRLEGLCHASFAHGMHCAWSPAAHPLPLRSSPPHQWPEIHVLVAQPGHASNSQGKGRRTPCRLDQEGDGKLATLQRGNHACLTRMRESTFFLSSALATSSFISLMSSIPVHVVVVRGKKAAAADRSLYWWCC